MTDGISTKTSVRIGCNFPIEKIRGTNAASDFIIPIMLNLLFGKHDLHFEFGLGGELFYLFPDNNTAAYGIFTSVLELRYQNCEKGIIARFGLTPTLGTFPASGSPGKVWLYDGRLFGASLGYSF